MKTSLLFAISLTTASVALAGTHVSVGLSFGVPPPIIVRHAPPARVVERVVVSPGPGYVWVSGHYTWAGNRWIWITGTWVVPPRPDAFWVDGQWSPQTRQWIEAHWEVRPAPVTMTAPPPVVAQPSEIIIQEAPPAPVVEVQTVAPSPDYVWISGYWGWEHGRREWYRGHWERPPHGYRVWVAPRWEHRHNGYMFVRGYWR